MADVLIPNTVKQDVVTYKILVDGAEINPAYQLLSLSISKEINRVPTVKIIFRDGDAARQTFDLSNQDEFIPGKKIKINIGRDSVNKQGFAGLIIKHSIKVKTSGHSELHIECMD